MIFMHLYRKFKITKTYKIHVISKNILIITILMITVNIVNIVNIVIVKFLL